MSPRASYPQAQFREEFDVSPGSNGWANKASTVTESIVAITDPRFGVAGNVFLAGGGTCWKEHTTNILIDPMKTYRISCRVRRTATSDNTKQFAYCGVAGVKADGVTYVNVLGENSFGSQHYFAAAALDLGVFPLNEWVVKEGFFNADLKNLANGLGNEHPDPNNPGRIHKDAVFFRPLFILNYDGGPAGNSTQIDYVRVDLVESPTEVVHLVELNFSGGSIYINTGAADLNWNGQTWIAVGGDLRVGPVEESSDFGNQGLDLQLSGVDPTLFATLLTNNFRGRMGKVYRAQLDASGVIRMTPLLLLQGIQLGAYEIVEDRSREGGTITMKTRLDGLMGLDRERGIWANLISHQHHYPTDTFMQNVAALAATPIYWAQKVPLTPGTGGPRGGREGHGSGRGGRRRTGP